MQKYLSMFLIIKKLNMKSFTKILFFFLALAQICFAQNGWFQQTSGTTNSLTGVSFIDANNGWTVGFSGTILRTTDGGENWISQASGINDDLYRVSFTDANNGTAVGDSGIILRTTNGGTNWFSQVSGTTNGLFGVSFTDANNGTAVGYNGTILRTTDGGASFFEEKDIDEIPKAYYLSNNYPNPFNPSTKIKYSVPQTSQVQIKVFDVLGNEITTLVNEEKPTGTYELDWNAENLPSGVYFYQLRAGSFVETKKMVLMK
jgi:hypothetical protein